MHHVQCFVVGCGHRQGHDSHHVQYFVVGCRHRQGHDSGAGHPRGAAGEERGVQTPGAAAAHGGGRTQELGGQGQQVSHFGDRNRWRCRSRRTWCRGC